MYSIIRVIKPRRIRCIGHVACMGEVTNSYKILVGEPERNTSLGRHKHMRVDNIKIDRKET
jgi:hypothetical protein